MIQHKKDQSIAHKGMSCDYIPMHPVCQEDLGFQANHEGPTNKKNNESE